MRRWIITMVAFVWLFSAVHSKMFLQFFWTRGCIITLIAFVWLFSTVCFQMSLQSACPIGCIFTLVALVWLFSNVRFQMSPQIGCPERCKVTLVAFIWLFSQRTWFPVPNNLSQLIRTSLTISLSHWCHMWVVPLHLEMTVIWGGRDVKTAEWTLLWLD